MPADVGCGRGATPAFAGIDVACAKGKRLPIVVCTHEGGAFKPLALRSRDLPKPPRGMGNPRAIDAKEVAAFAAATVDYLRAVEHRFAVSITCIAIDAPSDPKRSGERRRACERALDARRISCFTTPDRAEFATIVQKVRSHLILGGAANRLPHANQLWMLVGFALFRALRPHWTCLEVFPQAIVHVLGRAARHKRTRDGLAAQLAALADRTGWPSPNDPHALRGCGFAPTHDLLDAYLSAWVAGLPEAEREPLGQPPHDAIWVPRWRQG